MLHFTVCVDPALGRLDYSTMSTQALMEMFVEGLTPESKEIFQDDQGNYLDIEDWPGIKCGSDDLEIEWKDIHLEGSLTYQFMPPRTTIFIVEGDFRAIRSPLETSDLPRELEIFRIYRQAHFGTVDMTSLPPALVSFQVCNNFFEGTINLTALPSKITDISMSNNKLTGSIDISALPESMQILCLQYNNLSGTISFESLPETLRILHIERNAFTGSVDLSKRSAPIDIDASFNNFEGSMVVPANAEEFDLDFRATSVWGCLMRMARRMSGRASGLIEGLVMERLLIAIRSTEVFVILFLLVFPVLFNKIK